MCAVEIDIWDGRMDADLGYVPQHNGTNGSGTRATTHPQFKNSNTMSRDRR